ncbi:DUF4291 domain-containing protein [Undibacterium sp. Ji50W]|uniref:DUF4291 domain-containing protein n=1 Tax=Undibacterium sp. Ji50W TaxID=3413041 RepID=UPI003BF37FDA
MKFKNYLEQIPSWPESGKHVMAQFDDTSIIVYQAYRHEIANFAVQHQYFGGEFSYNRMSWIKPNFLWMMFRSGWAQKPGQERILALRIKRTFFDELLENAVSSSLDLNTYPTHAAWQQAVQDSDVRLQWDPDHDPAGLCVERRAVQLGLRGDALRRYGREEILEIIDVTAFVGEQRQHVQEFENLVIPYEAVYTSA